MPPIPSTPGPHLPRIITYFQTTHTRDGKPISVLPLIREPGVSVTHVIVAAIHLNEDPDAITLNDHHPGHERYQTMWAEMRILQASGVKILGMLGGHARGSYERLDADQAQFERYYAALHRMIETHALEGLDLDVEEPMSLQGIVRLIDRLRADFGPDFIITLAPVATALLGDDDPRRNLSGFGYDALHAERGHEIAWYNTQFYCGWGDCSNPVMYELIMSRGRFPADKVVVGLVTNHANGSGWVPWEMLASVLPILVGRRADFGGVMGWEYFNSLPGGEEKPWEWAMFMTALIRGDRAVAPQEQHVLESVESESQRERDERARQKKEAESQKAAAAVMEADPDDSKGGDAPVPHEFEYHSDGRETPGSP
ncbi:class III chitinase [Pyricularia oryzae 70-15]|uniref:Class III chitinase n=3 Tax=Pyricularia oryzae TaxID=318829 RepID=G4NGN8_PYRO7|nr:class III chitinase [Pyricularia oryzae 70-15]EHA47398.1 class III chitinase [Pyricularia oryzae 70-15]ELQ35787.1 chitinase 3 [Pyricularia oryzae Y34]KAI7924190.1 class III chitinase [Pyricularia oryzae]KAI7932549.1 class III chitinase [Pyricularia oryzae]